MSRSKKNWILVLAFNLLPLSLAVTTGVSDFTLVSQGDSCASIDRAPAAAAQPVTPEQLSNARWQVDHCYKSEDEITVAGQALRILVENNELSNIEIDRIIKKLDSKSASIELQKFRKDIEAAADKAELDDVKEALMDWAGDSENLKAAKDSEMSGANKVALLMKDIAAKQADLLKDSPSKNRVVIATLERALKIPGLSSSMAREIRDDISNFRQQTLLASAQGGMMSNPQFMIAYMEAMSAIQTNAMQPCMGWGIESMANCNAARLSSQNQMMALQQASMVAQRADLQKQRFQQQQDQMMQKMMDQMNQQMYQQSNQANNTQQPGNNYAPNNNYVNPLVANPYGPAVTGTGRNWF